MFSQKSHFGPGGVPIWSRGGPDLVPRGSRFGPERVPIWSREGPDLVPRGSRFGPKTSSQEGGPLSVKVTLAKYYANARVGSRRAVRCFPKLN